MGNSEDEQRMITLSRQYFKHYTKGFITLPDGLEIYTLELPWRNNEIGKSCIPEGEYIIDRNKTGRHKWYAFRNEETEPRTFIEIHPANKLSHLEGCIAPCLRLIGEPRESQPFAADSIKACKILLELFGDNSFHLLIREKHV